MIVSQGEAPCHYDLIEEEILRVLWFSLFAVVTESRQLCLVTCVGATHLFSAPVLTVSKQQWCGRNWKKRRRNLHGTTKY